MTAGARNLRGRKVVGVGLEEVAGAVDDEPLVGVMADRTFLDMLGEVDRRGNLRVIAVGLVVAVGMAGAEDALHVRQAINWSCRRVVFAMALETDVRKRH